MVDRFFRARNLKSPLRFISRLFSSIAWSLFTSLLPEVSFGQISDWLQVVDLILGCLEVKVLIWYQGFSFWEWFLSAPRASRLVQLHLRVPRASGWWLFLLVWFHSPFLDFSFSFQFVGWLLGEKRAPPRLRASALLSHLSLSRRKLVERRGMTQPLQFDWRLSTLQAKVRPEEIHPKEKCQFLPTSALRVWGTIQSDGMTISCDDFWVDLLDSNAGFLFTGNLWAWRTGIVHYEGSWDQIESREYLPHSWHPFNWTPSVWGQGMAHYVGIWA